jgi:hypothetical protein
MAVNKNDDGNTSPLYTAENEWQRRNPTAGSEITAGQARKLSRQILNHPSLDGIPGVEQARKSLLTKVSLRTGLLGKIAPGTSAATNGFGVTLYNKANPITVGTVTHETTHKILVHRGDVAPHGSEFSQLHSHIVNTTLGPTARVNLNAGYKKHNVK